ncbi:MAG TPA: hypothetical protein VH442_01235 [Micromonosporaceae bacterium]|jgi:uncharacterized protein (DUF1330 family)
MSFIQLIEYETDKPEAMQALSDEMEDAGMPTRITRMAATKNLDKPNGYVTIVEFPSYEEAMENSNSPDIQEFAQRMSALCTSPPRFINLDVMRDLS